MAINFAALPWWAQIGIGAGANTMGQVAIEAIFDDDEIVPALEVINNNLTRIDQALVDGFGGLDPAIERLRDQRAELLSDQGRVFGEMFEIARAQGIENPNVLEQLHMPDKLRTYGEAMPLWEHSERLVSIMEQLVQVQRDMEARRAELVSGVSPVSGVGAGAAGVGAVGANPNPNACCCAQEQVMGA